MKICPSSRYPRKYLLLSGHYQMSSRLIEALKGIKPSAVRPLTMASCVLSSPDDQDTITVRTPAADTR